MCTILRPLYSSFVLWIIPLKRRTSFNLRFHYISVWKLQVSCMLLWNTLCVIFNYRPHYRTSLKFPSVFMKLTNKINMMSSVRLSMWWVCNCTKLYYTLILSVQIFILRLLCIFNTVFLSTASEIPSESSCNRTDSILVNYSNIRVLTVHCPFIPANQ
jgi:hypothetical protein